MPLCLPFDFSLNGAGTLRSLGHLWVCSECSVASLHKTLRISLPGQKLRPWECCLSTMHTLHDCAKTGMQLVSAYMWPQVICPRGPHFPVTVILAYEIMPLFRSRFSLFVCFCAAGLHCALFLHLKGIAQLTCGCFHPPLNTAGYIQRVCILNSLTVQIFSWYWSWLSLLLIKTHSFHAGFILFHPLPKK